MKLFEDKFILKCILAYPAGIILGVIIIFLFGCTKARADKLFYTTDADATAYNDVIPYYVDSVPDEQSEWHWVYDTVLGTSIGTSDWLDTQWLATDGALTVTSSTGAGISVGWGYPEPDSTTHYWTKLDTTAVLHKVICDTTEMNRFSYVNMNDPAWDTVVVVDYKTKCDSLYILKIKPIWHKKIAMLFTPKEMDMLMELLYPMQLGVKE